MLRYFISREFLLTLLALIGGGLLLYLLIFFVLLPLYTRHGDGLMVPDVTNMSAEQAVQALEEAGFEPEISDSVEPPEVYMDKSEYWIMKQYPTPYTRVKPDRLIALTVQQLKPTPKDLPNLIDLSEGEAASRLANSGLTLGQIITKPYFADVVLGAMYEGKELKPGDKLPPNAEVDIIVGSGSNAGRVQIPDLEGYAYEDALSLLTEAGLGVGIVLYNANGPADQYGKVYKQNPRPGLGDSIRMGTSIDLYIYGEEPTSTEGIEFEEVGAGGN